GRLQGRHGPPDVGPVIAERRRDRGDDVREPGQVKDHVDSGKARGDRVVLGHVDQSQGDGRAGGQIAEVLAPSGRQVVEDHDAVAVGDQAPDQMAADEPTTARAERCHRLPPRNPPPRTPAARKRPRYLLTARGISEKTRLTYEHIAYALNLYRRARQTLRGELSRLPESGMKRIALYGTDEAAELAYLTLKEAGIEPV